MYENADLDAAVKAGIFPPEATEKFRSFAAKRAGRYSADEEHFRLAAGLLDVFVSIGIILLFFSLYVATRSDGPASGLLFAGLAWALAEYFVRHRKMLLPGFLLLAILIGGSVFGFFALSLELPGPLPSPFADLRTIISGSLTSPRNLLICCGVATLCWLYWHRFGVAIAYAAMAFALYNVPDMLLRIFTPNYVPALEGVGLFGCGLVTFAVAMWWDMTDIYRQTRRADVAFWLHGLAGLIIANVGFRYVIGMHVGGPEPFETFQTAMMSLSALQACYVLALYAAFTTISLITDRRALMMSGLMFAFSAFATLSGAQEGSWPVIFGAVVMAILILFAAIWWVPLRRTTLNLLPLSVRAQLPRTELQRPRPRPVT